MTSTPKRAGMARPGGRTARVREAVFAATLAEFSERGFAALSIEGIAVRSGVHKTTIYRRWETRENLLSDAVGELAEVRVPVADTGSIEGDLRALARDIVGFLNSDLGAVGVAVLFADAPHMPALAQIKRNFFAARHRLAAPIVERAVARGELPAGTDARELIGMAVAPVWYRRLVTGEPIDSTVADRAAAAALAAGRAGAFQLRPRRARAGAKKTKSGARRGAPRG
jgi:AcrR family transcriptional regulator